MQAQSTGPSGVEQTSDVTSVRVYINNVNETTRPIVPRDSQGIRFETILNQVQEPEPLVDSTTDSDDDPTHGGNRTPRSIQTYEFEYRIDENHNHDEAAFGPISVTTGEAGYTGFRFELHPPPAAGPMINGAYSPLSLGPPRHG